MKIRKTILVDSEKWKQFRASLILLEKSVSIQIEEMINNFIKNQERNKNRKKPLNENIKFIYKNQKGKK